MATITIPSGIRIESSTFGLRSYTQMFISASNQATQRIELAGARWIATYNLTLHKRAEIAELQAFLIKLRGQANTFYGYDPDAKTPRGVATGSPKVNGSSQTGTTLITDGWTASTTNILRIGDYIQVNNELKQIVQDVNSDSGGNATLTFEPPLRFSPADDDDITTSQASAIMRLSSDEIFWNVDKRNLYKIAFSGLEVIGL
jgi:hypothetical protein